MIRPACNCWRSAPEGEPKDHALTTKNRAPGLDPLGWLAGHQGISDLLVVLVFATALTIDPVVAR